MRKVLDKITGLPYLPEDIGMRLLHSVVMIRDKPAYILDVAFHPEEPGADVDYLEPAEIKSVSLEYKYLSEPNRSRALMLPSEHLSLAPIPLGYVNCKERGSPALYLSRVPKRRYKQGLNSGTLAVSGSQIREAQFLEMIFLYDLQGCIENKYPSLEECIRLAKVHDCTAAFSRRWAVCPKKLGRYTTLYLEYRSTRVGVIKGGKVTLNDDYEFLAEELERVHAKHF